MARDVKKAKEVLIKEYQSRKSRNYFLIPLSIVIIIGLAWIEWTAYSNGIFMYIFRYMAVGTVLLGIVIVLPAFGEISETDKEIEKIRKMPDREFERYIMKQDLKIGMAALKLARKLFFN